MSKDDDCGCKDPCSKVMQGVQGLQGVQGPRGQDGLQGPQGIQGEQGIAGSCVNCPGGSGPIPPVGTGMEFAEVYSTTAQLLTASPGLNMPGQVALLENSVHATANIDISNAATTGQIKINKAGWYDVATGVAAFMNPIPAPLPVFSVALFLNGVLVKGSPFANLPLSPAQASNEVVADVFVHCNVGDALTLANTSTAPINLSSIMQGTNGTNVTTNSAYLKITLLLAD